ncbi:hypothetical protein HDF11_003431 [Tunturiibacter psychrotolerans]
MLLFHLAASFVSTLLGCDDQIDRYSSDYKSREPRIGGTFDRELEVRREEEINEDQDGETDRKDANSFPPIQAANHDSKVKTGGRSACNPRQDRRGGAHSYCKQITLEFSGLIHLSVVPSRWLPCRNFENFFSSDFDSRGPGFYPGLFGRGATTIAESNRNKAM